MRVDGDRVVARLHQVFFNASYQPLEVVLLAPDPGPGGELGLQVRSPVLEVPPLPHILTAEAAQAMTRDYALRGGNPAALARPPGESYAFGPFPVGRGEYLKVDWRVQRKLAAKPGGLKVLAIAPGARPPRPLALNALELDLPAALASNTYSPTHRLLERPGEEGRVVLNPVVENADPSQPLVLLWPPEPGAPGVIRGATPDGEALGLALVPPAESRREVGRRCWVVAQDVGGSLRGPPYREAIRIVEGILSTLGPGDLFDLVPFAAFPQPFQRLPVPATPENIARAVDFLRRREPRGAVNFEAALLTALEVAGQAPEGFERAVLLLTDGRPTLGEVRARSILEQRPDSRAPIFPVASGADTDYYFLEQLARLSGGTAIFHEAEEDPLRLVRARVRPAPPATAPDGPAWIRIDGERLREPPELRHDGARVLTFPVEADGVVEIRGREFPVREAADAGLLPFLVHRARALGSEIWASLQERQAFPGGAHSFRLLGLVPGTPRPRILHTIRDGVGPLGRARMFALQGLLDHGIYQPVAPGPNRAWSGNRYFLRDSDEVWVESGLRLDAATRVAYGSGEHARLMALPEVGPHLGLDRQVALFVAPGKAVLVRPAEAGTP